MIRCMMFQKPLMVENTEVLSWIIQELIIEQGVQGNEGIQVLDS